MAQSQAQTIKRDCTQAVPLSGSMTVVVEEPGTQGLETSIEEREEESLYEGCNGEEFGAVLPF